MSEVRTSDIAPDNTRISVYLSSYVIFVEDCTLKLRAYAGHARVGYSVPARRKRKLRPRRVPAAPLHRARPPKLFRLHHAGSAGAASRVCEAASTCCLTNATLILELGPSMHSRNRDPKKLLDSMIHLKLSTNKDHMAGLHSNFVKKSL